jgi:predicted extracellular nuclease
MAPIKIHQVWTHTTQIHPYQEKSLMTRRTLITLSLLIILLLNACTQAETATQPPPTQKPTKTVEVEPTAAPTPAPPELETPRVLISEVLAGVQGNNNFEFIELYNTGDQEPVDLQGWSIWYQLTDTEDETLVYRWSEHALVPPNGHYLLGRAGEDLGLPVDMPVTQPLVPQKGGLQLRQTDGTPLDGLSWGGGPENFAEGALAPAMENGVSLERSPGGEDGNWSDTNNNSNDFQLSQAPDPQNAGSPVTPVAGGGLAISLEAPESVEPGGQFEYTVSVSNQTGQDLHEVLVELPISADLVVMNAPDEVEITDQVTFYDVSDMLTPPQVLRWELEVLETGKSATTQITVGAPWTYLTAPVVNYFVRAQDWPTLAFGPPVRTAVEGGVVPIASLKELIGAELTIEGTATMYTGGYYAGTGNVKFYLQDETGGVQVWVPTGQGSVNVYIGSQVRVHGVLQLYRGALELVTNTPEDVEILAAPTEEAKLPPQRISIGEAANNPDLRGSLIQVEGVVTRVEEFTYSYEIDLLDEAGDILTLYVDKETNMIVEFIETGQSYRATGILEIYDIEHQLYPRIQADLEQIYPPVLMVDLEAPITVKQDELLLVTLTAYNHTPEPLTNVVITATLPAKGAQFDSALDGGEVSGSNVVWQIPELDGGGASASVGFQVKATASKGFLTLTDYWASAAEWDEPVTGQPHYTFLGDSVPIWAIQGQGFRSPYVLEPVKTKGIVTAIFPELGGFFIQEAYTDADPLTSAGLFINSGELEIDLLSGAYVLVNGTVREASQQTQIMIESFDDVSYIQQDGAFPIAVELAPPPEVEEARWYYEALEGMLVQVTGPALAVAPTNKYGEYTLVLPEHGVDRLWQGDDEHNGIAIPVDDGSAVTHTDQSTLPYVVNRGDQLYGLFGPLAYTYGQYKIEPTTIPQIEAGVNELPTLTPTSEDEFSIMTWNVENLFDTRTPHPDDPPLPTGAEYRLDLAKVANTIAAAGAPTIVGLQEVENLQVLEAIASQEVLAPYSYQAILIEGTDSRGIDNGYLVRGDRAEVLDVQQHITPEGLTSRPPLLIKIEVTTASGPVTLYVVNNHFTAMSGGEAATEPRRNAQAAWNVTVLEGVLAEDKDALVAIIGDLNSFYTALPIDTLREAGLRHVFEVLPEEERYTYIYQGACQALDHILVTPALMEWIKRVELLRVNADFAMPEPGDESPQHKSDHDPLVATFSLSK